MKIFLAVAMLVSTSNLFAEDPTKIRENLISKDEKQFNDARLKLKSNPDLVKLMMSKELERIRESEKIIPELFDLALNEKDFPWESIAGHLKHIKSKAVLESFLMCARNSKLPKPDLIHFIDNNSGICTVLAARILAELPEKENLDLATNIFLENINCHEPSSFGDPPSFTLCYAMKYLLEISKKDKARLVERILLFMNEKGIESAVYFRALDVLLSIESKNRDFKYYYHGKPHEDDIVEMKSEARMLGIRLK